MTKRETYIAKMHLQLEELNQTMQSLDAKAKDAKEDARDKYREELAILKAKSKLAVDKLEAMKEATEDGWEAMVAEMEKVRDAFTHSFRYFKSQL